MKATLCNRAELGRGPMKATLGFAGFSGPCVNLRFLSLYNIRRRRWPLLAQHRIEDVQEGVARLVEGQPDDDKGRNEGPSNADADPHGPIALAEDTSGHGQQRPNDDHDDGEGQAPLSDPSLGFGQELFRVVLLRQATLVILEHLDIAHALEVVVLRPRQRAHHVDEARGHDGDEVAGQVRLQLAECVHRDLTRLSLRHDDPSDEGQHQATPSSSNGTDRVRVLPHEHVPQRHHGGADGRAHEHVDPTQVQAHGVQQHREHAHGQAEDHDHDLRDQKDPAAICLWVDVGPVDVVGHQRRHGDALGGARGDDGHEEHDRHHHGAARAEEVGGHCRRDEASSCLGGTDRQLQGHACQAQGCREREGDREPDQAPEEVALVSARGLRSDGGLPIGLVHEDCAEVPDDVDDAKLQAAQRHHREVGALLVIHHRPARVGALLEERLAAFLEDQLACIRRVGRDLLQHVVDAVRGVGLHIDRVDADH
mmetsp:Transcript_95294/g.248444  ORF Transcript_95294/g.248444 Transcript_95294/m.248444 type:complete len:481 (-) Transcript_95294:567-2009(-)